MCCAVRFHSNAVIGGDRKAHLQNFGFFDGVPGTRYNKAVKAAESIEEIMQPILREALADEENQVKSDSALGRLLKVMREEGAEIMQSEDLDEVVSHFSFELLSLMFAGRSCMPAVPVLVAATCDTRLQQ
jgi:hypothetical protein